MSGWLQEAQGRHSLLSMSMQDHGDPVGSDSPVYILQNTMLQLVLKDSF